MSPIKARGVQDSETPEPCVSFSPPPTCYRRMGWLCLGPRAGGSRNCNSAVPERSSVTSILYAHVHLRQRSMKKTRHVGCCTNHFAARGNCTSRSSAVAWTRLCMRSPYLSHKISRLCTMMTVWRLGTRWNKTANGRLGGKRDAPVPAEPRARCRTARAAPHPRLAMAVETSLCTSLYISLVILNTKRARG